VGRGDERQGSWPSGGGGGGAGRGVVWPREGLDGRDRGRLPTLLARRNAEAARSALAVTAGAECVLAVKEWVGDSGCAGTKRVRGEDGGWVECSAPFTATSRSDGRSHCQF
jgi:hypothetical protein